MEVTIPSTICDDCKNKSICKYTEEMQDVQKNINALPIPLESPISVDTKCRRYEKRTQKQDGIVYR